MNLFFVRESYNQSGTSGWGDGEFGGWVLIKEIKFKVFFLLFEVYVLIIILIIRTQNEVLHN